MAKQRMIEEETGISTRIHRQHTHNGYFAGDFTDVPFLDPQDPVRTFVRRSDPAVRW
jgi:hypothetical protein